MGVAPHGGEGWSCPLFSAFTGSRSSIRDHTCPSTSGGSSADPSACSGEKPALRPARVGDDWEETEAEALPQLRRPCRPGPAGPQAGLAVVLLSDSPRAV